MGRGRRRADRAGWLGLYEWAHPDIFEVYYRERGEPDHRATAAGQAGVTALGIARAERRARTLVLDAARRFGDGGLMKGGQDLPAVLLVGVGTANGWVADLHGRPTLFLALEMFPSRRSTRSLSCMRRLTSPNTWPAR